jgi:serine/threonine protein kinase
VYRATELETGRPVALKLLRLTALLPHVLEAFDREVKALGAVGAHPNIVTLYRTLNTPDGRPVLVLELCKGSMAERVRQQGPLPVAETVSVGIKIAGALETAHRAGLLHRDMKPQNILITQYGEPALADFGVAALQASAQTTEGVFGFTTLHASPEVLEGGQLSPATDVYGLASSVYQLIAGRAPFAAFDGEAPASVILRILRDPVTPLRLQQVPLELSDLLQMALAKSPQERPATAAAFADALRRVEQSCSWPATPYAVWGDAPAPAPLPAASAPPTMGTLPLPGAPPTLPPLAPPAAPVGPGIVTPPAARRNLVSPNSRPPVTPPPPAAPSAPTPSFSPDTPPRGQAKAAPSPAQPGSAAPGRRVGRRQPGPPPSPVWTTPPSPSGWGVAEGPYEQTPTHRGLTSPLRARLEGNPPIRNPGVPNHGKGFILVGAVGLAVVALVMVICILTGAV